MATIAFFVHVSKSMRFGLFESAIGSRSAPRLAEPRVRLHFQHNVGKKREGGESQNTERTLQRLSGHQKHSWPTMLKEFRAILDEHRKMLTIVCAFSVPCIGRHRLEDRNSITHTQTRLEAYVDSSRTTLMLRLCELSPDLLVARTRNLWKNSLISGAATRAMARCQTGHLCGRCSTRSHTWHTKGKAIDTPH